MSFHETSRLGMPLVQQAQAQKHVTVNEALLRLDGMVNLVLQSLSRSAPPAVVPEAQCWSVPVGASGAWAGQAGRIAIASNGGWTFVQPSPGMRAFVTDRGVDAVHDGRDWICGAMSLGGLGSALVAGLEEREVSVGTGAVFDTGMSVPAGAMMIGACARVTEPISGSLKTWKLGTEGAEDRFGSGLGTGRGSWGRGILGTPTTYYQSKPLLMTAEGGEFAGGRVRLALHWLELRLPS